MCKSMAEHLLQCACGQRTIMGTSSLLGPCGSQGLESGHQVGQQAPLPAEPSCWPRIFWTSD